MAGIVLCQIRKSVPQSQKFHRTNICCVVKLNYIKCRESADLKCTTMVIYVDNRWGWEGGGLGKVTLSIDIPSKPQPHKSCQLTTCGHHTPTLPKLFQTMFPNNWFKNHIKALQQEFLVIKSLKVEPIAVFGVWGFVTQSLLSHP